MWVTELERSATKIQCFCTTVRSYTYVNVDEGWLVGREKTAPYAMVEDKKAFPSTMAGLGRWIHSLDVPGKGKIMQYGLYTCRGVQQCDTGEYIKRCEAAQASGLMPSQTKGRCEGSHGFEKQVRLQATHGVCARRHDYSI